MQFIETNHEALWDEESQQVFALRIDGTEYSTGVPRSEGSTPEWRRVVDALPEDYIPGHPHILGRSVFETDDTFAKDVVLRTYPDADYSPQGFKERSAQRVRDRAHQALVDTDWYVVREMEVGKPIPTAIKEARVRVRNAVKKDLDRLEQAAVAEYVEFGPVEVTAAHQHMQRVLRGDDDE